MSAMHDEHGRFAKGNPGGPGRPKRAREVEFYRIMETTVTPERWRKVCLKALQQAEHGDAVARKWLSDYLIGAPVQRTEHSGLDGGHIVVRLINDDD